MKFAFAAVVILTGCAQTYWAHANKSAQDFYADSNECLAQAHQAIPVVQVQPQAPQAPLTQPLVGETMQRGIAAGMNAAAVDQANSQRAQMHEYCLGARGWYTYSK